jgi:hypothetical protein
VRKRQEEKLREVVESQSKLRDSIAINERLIKVNERLIAAHRRHWRGDWRESS